MDPSAETPPHPRALRRDAQKRVVLDAAAQLLVANGRSGLSARKLADAAGCSTKIIYSHFGGMGDVIAALYTQAFSDLASVMAKAGSSHLDPGSKLRAMARRYRTFLLANPELAKLMYGSQVTTLAPTPSDRDVATSSIDLYVQAYLGLGEDNETARSAAYALWAATHGAVSLELTGWLEGEAVFESVLANALRANLH